MNVMKSKYLYLIGMIAVLLSSCSVSRHLPEGGYLLDEVKVISGENPKVVSSLKPQVRQQPNIRTFGLFRLPLGVYCLTGTKDHAFNRFLRNIGEAPRVYDEALARKSCEAMEQTLVNQGYLKATAIRVDADTAALLAAVLKGVKSVVRGRCNVLRLIVGVNSEYAACFFDFTHFCISVV